MRSKIGQNSCISLCNYTPLNYINWINIFFSNEKSSDENVIDCKLIDFNTAVVNGQYPIGNMKNFDKYIKSPKIIGTNQVVYF